MRIATCSKLITALIACLALASLSATLLHAYVVQERDHSCRMLVASLAAEGEIEINLGGHRLSSSQLELNIFGRDSGIGLTAEQQEALFDSVYQADTSSTRQYGGTDLGLALSRSGHASA